MEGEEAERDFEKKRRIDVEVITVCRSVGTVFGRALP